MDASSTSILYSPTVRNRPGAQAAAGGSSGSGSKSVHFEPQTNLGLGTPRSSLSSEADVWNQLVSGNNRSGAVGSSSSSSRPGGTGAGPGPSPLGKYSSTPQSRPPSNRYDNHFGPSSFSSSSHQQQQLRKPSFPRSPSAGAFQPTETTSIPQTPKPPVQQTTPIPPQAPSSSSAFQTTTAASASNIWSTPSRPYSAPATSSWNTSNNNPPPSTPIAAPQPQAQGGLPHPPDGSNPVGGGGGDGDFMTIPLKPGTNPHRQVLAERIRRNGIMLVFWFGVVKWWGFGFGGDCINKVGREMVVERWEGLEGVVGFIELAIPSILIYNFFSALHSIYYSDPNVQMNISVPLSPLQQRANLGRRRNGGFTTNENGSGSSSTPTTTTRYNNNSPSPSRLLSSFSDSPTKRHPVGSATTPISYRYQVPSSYLTSSSPSQSSRSQSQSQSQSNFMTPFQGQSQTPAKERSADEMALIRLSNRTTTGGHSSSPIVPRSTSRSISGNEVGGGKSSAAAETGTGTMGGTFGSSYLKRSGMGRGISSSLNQSITDSASIDRFLGRINADE